MGKNKKDDPMFGGGKPLRGKTKAEKEAGKKSKGKSKSKKGKRK